VRVAGRVPGCSNHTPVLEAGIQSNITEVLEHVRHEQEARGEQGDDTKTNKDRKQFDFSRMRSDADDPCVRDDCGAARQAARERPGLKR
jgi:hypothetical protein